MNAIDTNLLVYMIDETDHAKHVSAIEFLNQLSTVETVLPWQTCVEFLAWLRRAEQHGRMTPDRVEADFNAVRHRFAISIPSENVLDIAIDLKRRHSLSHWDSLLLAACIEAGVDTLYSEDMGDGVVYDSVTVINPLKSPGPIKPSAAN